MGQNNLQEWKLFDSQKWPWSFGVLFCKGPNRYPSLTWPRAGQNQDSPAHTETQWPSPVCRSPGSNTWPFAPQCPGASFSPLRLDANDPTSVPKGAGWSGFKFVELFTFERLVIFYQYIHMIWIWLNTKLSLILRPAAKFGFCHVLPTIGNGNWRLTN